MRVAPVRLALALAVGGLDVDGLPLLVIATPSATVRRGRAPPCDGVRRVVADDGSCPAGGADHAVDGLQQLARVEVVGRQLDADELVVVAFAAVDLAGLVVDVLGDVLRQRVARVAQSLSLPVRFERLVAVAALQRVRLEVP